MPRILSPLLFLLCLSAITTIATANDIFIYTKDANLPQIKSLILNDPSLINSTDTNGKTPLITAAQAGNLEITKYLVENGANLEALTNYGDTALIYATYFNKPEIVEYLLTQKASPNILTSDGDTALDLAMMMKFDAISTLLKVGGGVETELVAPQIDEVVKNIHKIAYEYSQPTNVMVCTTPQGILLVDTAWQRTATHLQNLLNTEFPGKINYIINTHEHHDHIGGNEIADQQTKVIRLQNFDQLLDDGVIKVADGPVPSRSLKTFEKYYYFTYGGQEIRLIPSPGAHTEDDIIIHFTESNVVHMGDLLILESFPSVSVEVDKYLDILDTVAAVFPEDVTLVSGHCKTGTLDDVREYRLMLIDVRETVEALITKGQTKEQILIDPAFDQYDSYATSIPILKVDYWIEAVYRSHSG